MIQHGLAELERRAALTTEEREAEDRARRIGREAYRDFLASALLYGAVELVFDRVDGRLRTRYPRWPPPAI